MSTPALPRRFLTAASGQRAACAASTAARFAGLPFETSTRPKRRWPRSASGHGPASSWTSERTGRPSNRRRWRQSGIAPCGDDEHSAVMAAAFSRTPPRRWSGQPLTGARRLPARSRTTRVASGAGGVTCAVAETDVKRRRQNAIGIRMVVLRFRLRLKRRRLARPKRRYGMLDGPLAQNSRVWHCGRACSRISSTARQITSGLEPLGPQTSGQVAQG